MEFSFQVISIFYKSFILLYEAEQNNLLQFGIMEHSNLLQSGIQPNNIIIWMYWNGGQCFSKEDHSIYQNFYYIYIFYLKKRRE